MNEIMFRKNAIEMYSTHNEGKSVVTERFIRTLKNKIYKYMTSMSKNVYIDKLDDIVNKNNNTINMEAVDVKSNTYIDASKKINDKNPKFKIGDNVRISRYKNVFVKGYTPTSSNEIFVIKVISDLKGKEIVGTFYEKELQKANQKDFRVEKVIKRKGDKLYVKWKDCNSFLTVGLVKKT